MSVKYFCDICTTELSRQDHDRVRRKLGNVAIEVLHCFNGTWNAGNICHPCIMKTITGGEQISDRDAPRVF